MVIDAHFVSIDLEPLDGPATIVSLDGEARDIGGGAPRVLAPGDTVDGGAHLILSAGTRLILRLADGTDAVWAAPPEAGSSIAFERRDRLEPARGPALYEAQVQGFMQLHQQAKEFGFDPDAMLSAMPMGALAGDATDLLTGFAFTGGPAPLNAAQANALGVVPLGEAHGAVLVAAERWTVERALGVLAALKRGISTLTVSAEQFAALRQRVYG